MMPPDRVHPSGRQTRSQGRASGITLPGGWLLPAGPIDPEPAQQKTPGIQDVNLTFVFIFFNFSPIHAFFFSPSPKFLRFFYPMLFGAVFLVCTFPKQPSRPPRLFSPGGAGCVDDGLALPFPLHPQCAYALFVSRSGADLPFFPHDTWISVSCNEFKVQIYCFPGWWRLLKVLIWIHSLHVYGYIWHFITLTVYLLAFLLLHISLLPLFARVLWAPTLNNRRLWRNWNVVMTNWIGISIFWLHTILAYSAAANAACVKHLRQLHLIGWMWFWCSANAGNDYTYSPGMSGMTHSMPWLPSILTPNESQLNTYDKQSKPFGAPFDTLPSAHVCQTRISSFTKKNCLWEFSKSYVAVELRSVAQTVRSLANLWRMRRVTETLRLGLIFLVSESDCLRHRVLYILDRLGRGVRWGSFDGVTNQILSLALSVVWKAAACSTWMYAIYWPGSSRTFASQRQKQS